MKDEMIVDTRMGLCVLVFSEGDLLPMMDQIKFTLKMENMNIVSCCCGDCALYSSLIVPVLFTYRSDTNLHFEALLVSSKTNTIKVNRISSVTAGG